MKTINKIPSLKLNNNIILNIGDSRFQYSVYLGKRENATFIRESFSTEDMHLDGDKIHHYDTDNIWFVGDYDYGVKIINEVKTIIGDKLLVCDFSELSSIAYTMLTNMYHNMFITNCKIGYSISAIGECLNDIIHIEDNIKNNKWAYFDINEGMIDCSDFFYSYNLGAGDVTGPGHWLIEYYSRPNGSGFINVSKTILKKMLDTIINIKTSDIYIKHD